MSVIEAPRATGRSTSRTGGAGFVVGGVLQLLPMVSVLAAAATAVIAPAWQLAGWTVGGLVLMGAAVMLAIGRRGEPGIVGPSQGNRLALILAGAPGILVAAVALLTVSIGAPAFAWSTVLVIGTQVLVLVASSAAARAAVRAHVLTGAARWALVALVAVDAAALLAYLVPAVLSGVGGGVASLFVLLVARPAVVVAIGVVLVATRRR